MLLENIDKKTVYSNLLMLERYKALHLLYENMKNNYQKKDEIYRVLGMLDELSVQMGENPVELRSAQDFVSKFGMKKSKEILAA